jgi:dolichol-phosphate mannosyltransferase
MASRLASLPVINEAQNLKILIPQLMCLSDLTVHIVDDESTDETCFLVEEFKETYGENRILYTRNESRIGFAASHLLSYKYVIDNENFTHLIQMDSDLSHRVEDLVSMLDETDSSVGLLIGSRYVPGGATLNWPFSRKIVSRFANLLVKLVIRVQVKDSTSGFRVLNRSLVKEIVADFNNIDGYIFQVFTVQTALKHNFSVREIPITFVEREFGSSKMSLAIAFEGFYYLVKSRIVG